MRKVLPLVPLLVAAVLLLAGCGADVTLETKFHPDGSGLATMTVSIPQSDIQGENLTTTDVQKRIESALPPGWVETGASPDADPATFEFQYPFKSFSEYQTMEAGLTGGELPQDSFQAAHPTPWVSEYSYTNRTDPNKYAQWLVNAGQDLPDRNSLIGSVTMRVGLPGEDTREFYGSAQSAVTVPVTVKVENRVRLFGRAEQIVTLSWPKGQADPAEFLKTHAPKGASWKVDVKKGTAILDVRAGSWEELSKKMAPVFSESLKLSYGNPVSFLKSEATLQGTMDPVSWLGADGNMPANVYSLSTSAYLGSVESGNGTKSPGFVSVKLRQVTAGQAERALAIAVVLAVLIAIASVRRTREAIASLARKGADLARSASTAGKVVSLKPSEPKFCASCGAPVSTGDRFCGSCGARLAS